MAASIRHSSDSMQYTSTRKICYKSHAIASYRQHDWFIKLVGCVACLYNLANYVHIFTTGKRRDCRGNMLVSYQDTQGNFNGFVVMASVGGAEGGKGWIIIEMILMRDVWEWEKENVHVQWWYIRVCVIVYHITTNI